MASYIQDEVCVEANVKVAPEVKIKNIQTSFVGEPVVEACAETPACSYAVSQMLCLKYSVDFSANVQAAPAGIVCSPQIQGTALEQVCPDVLAGPSVTTREPKANDYFEQQASMDYQTDELKRPSPMDRFADRNITISKSAYENYFLKNPAFLSSRH